MQVCSLLGEENPEEKKEAHIEALKSEVILKRRSIPQYMMQGGPPAVSEERQFARAPNRGPFADRVRNRMIELGFKSRRGT